MDPSRDKVGFIGTGVMGSSMAANLMHAGYRVSVYSRSKTKADKLISEGAIWEGSPAELARKCNVIMTMVGYPEDVEQLYFGQDGIIENAAPGSYLVDTTTSRPDLAGRVFEAAKNRGLHALDAPVSGGDLGAKNATLTIMVGGDPEDFEAVRDILEILGKTVVLQGSAGAGQHTKMANQIAIAGSLAGAVEAIKYSESAGLDPRRVLVSIGPGSAGSWQLNNMVPRMLDGNFEPGFYVKHFLKDLRIALDAAKAMKIRLPLLEQAESVFDAMQESGFGEKGTQSLYLYYGRCFIEGWPD